MQATKFGEAIDRCQSRRTILAVASTWAWLVSWNPGCL